VPKGGIKPFPVSLYKRGMLIPQKEDGENRAFKRGTSPSFFFFPLPLIRREGGQRGIGYR
jgi:hypothetical protein